jgi:hypothetical protein
MRERDKGGKRTREKQNKDERRTRFVVPASNFPKPQHKISKKKGRRPKRKRRRRRRRAVHSASLLQTRKFPIPARVGDVYFFF